VLVYEPISKFGWEQEGNTVKIYITSGIEGVGKIERSNIDCEFNDQAVDLRILHFNGKNLRLKIAPLNGLIDPAACKIKVKSNSLTIEMVKAKNKHWDDIKEKKKPSGETSSSSSKKDEKEGDPNASLMNMMKELYETGDDNMKRTIAESW
jgi:calcyclin binding protein